jgi:hypothetical protein
MRKMLIALGLVAAATLATPHPASAQVGISIGLPGFGLFIGAPAPAYYGPSCYRPAYYGPAHYGGGYYRRAFYGRPFSGRGFHGRGGCGGHRGRW